jgi:hypothetical protein
MLDSQKPLMKEIATELEGVFSHETSLFWLRKMTEGFRQWENHPRRRPKVWKTGRQKSVRIRAIPCRGKSIYFGHRDVSESSDAEDSLFTLSAPKPWLQKVLFTAGFVFND